MDDLFTVKTMKDGRLWTSTEGKRCPGCDQLNAGSIIYIKEPSEGQLEAIASHAEAESREAEGGVDRIKKHFDKQSAGAAVADLRIHNAEGKDYIVDGDHSCQCWSCKTEFEPAYKQTAPNLGFDKDPEPKKKPAAAKKQSQEGDQGDQEDDFKPNAVDKIASGLRKTGALQNAGNLKPADEKTTDELKTAVRDKGSTNRHEDMTSLMSRGLKKSGLTRSRKIGG